jgi:hypothetical protein
MKYGRTAVRPYFIRVVPSAARNELINKVKTKILLIILRFLEIPLQKFLSHLSLKLMGRLGQKGH